ncbi:MAG: LacI family DNA-binding transcriptional regulator [Lautropia sp.]
MARRKSVAPTSYDVARHAGVSQAVVSRAFQADAPISAEARARVLASAAALGYQPNAVARSLITRRSGLAGVLLTEATQRDTPEVLIQLSQALLAHGFQPLLFPCSEEAQGDGALDSALAFGVDGIVSCIGLSPPMLARARQRQRPIVLFNRQGAGVAQVACDHASATRLLASRLYAAGHRRFAVVTGPRDAPVSTLRVEGFLARLGELGVTEMARHEGNYHYESGHAAALHMLAPSRSRRHARLPQVVFCANDAMALGVLDAARFTLMLRVPSDVSVIGFDDIPDGRRPTYLLTTVSQPFAEMAQAAASLLRRQVRGEPLPSGPLLLSGRLIERGSAQLLPDSATLGAAGKR